jgi:hypothetical protein
MQPVATPHRYAASNSREHALRHVWDIRRSIVGRSSLTCTAVMLPLAAAANCSIENDSIQLKKARVLACVIDAAPAKTALQIARVI